MMIKLNHNTGLEKVSSMFAAKIGIYIVYLWWYVSCMRTTDKVASKFDLLVIET